MTESSLIGAWRKYLSSSAAGLHLVDSLHPLQFYIGRTDLGLPRVVIRSTAMPRMLTLSEVVLVERFQDESGKWNFSFTLQDSEFAEVFLRLADDMHARSAEAMNERVAIDRVSVVIDEWRRLLKARPSGVLSMEELRGLIGELWLILYYFSKDRSLDAAIEGWLGPLGLPQDFWYADDGYSEAKSIGPSTTRIKIASERQLDASDLDLIVLLVGNTDEQSSGAVNLPTLTVRVQAAIADSAGTDGHFQERLTRLGVDLRHALYQETWFVVSQVTHYDVRADFPAIRASSLTPGIDRVSYQIDLAAIDEFIHLSTEVV